MEVYPPFTSIITGNCQLLCNKFDELKACVWFKNEYRESCMMCFSETWFSPRNTDNNTSIDGFTCVRGDRTSDSGKRSGGGVCV